MGYKRSNHKNALVKLIKEKRMILKVDAESIMNNSNLNHTSKVLSEEGKIKREKVKVRYKNGNLNNCWLLMTNDVKYEEVLEYEKELINRPFESPLKKYHCYKKHDVIPVEDSNKEHKIVNISEYTLGIKEYNGQRVVTFDDIDSLHQRPYGTARKRFGDHKDKFVEGEDYFVFKGKKGREALKSLNYPLFGKLPTSNNFKYYLITESGYLLLVKSFTDVLAWEVQKKLVSSYFKLKEVAGNNTDVKNNLQAQGFDSLDILENMIKEMKSNRQEIKNQNNRITQLEDTIYSLKKALL